ncbi:MAG TPA: cytochrome b N-terminal domain-containing protein, partial [Thermoleophilia bacterium]|nr:cytochrome b N-terminal domain-containing protein [Thermoleophilia bacterium]
PGTETARASVQHLVTAVTLGSFLRGIHYWAAMAMVVLLGLHLVRVFVTGAFKRPREATWLLGVALVGIVGLFFVSGTILKWDQEAFEAFDHSIELGGVLGRFLGFWLEPTFGAPMLLRLYTVHVAILPLLFAAVLAGHLLLVKHHGLAPSPFYRGPQPEPTVPFSSHIGRLAGLTAIVAGIASVLAVLSPPGLGPAPVEGLEVTKPPWPILWWYAVENLVGVSGILWATLVVLVALVVTPFVDRGTERHPWKRLPVLISAAILVAAVVALTLYALLAPVKPHIEM